MSFRMLKSPATYFKCSCRMHPLWETTVFVLTPCVRPLLTLLCCTQLNMRITWESLSSSRMMSNAAWSNLEFYSKITWFKILLFLASCAFFALIYSFYSYFALTKNFQIVLEYQIIKHNWQTKHVLLEHDKAVQLLLWFPDKRNSCMCTV